MSAVSQLPVLPVIVPLVSAPIVALLPKGRAPWVAATLVAWATFGLCIALLLDVRDVGLISYALGDWAPPVGIEYRVDLANALVLCLVSGIASAVFPFAYESVASEIDARQSSNFYSALLICMTGLLGVTIT
ncbi:MAG: monovalent cation/H+ antiporter subunit D family protein, partial [Pseudomonadota bacterium]